MLRFATLRPVLCGTRLVPVLSAWLLGMLMWLAPIGEAHAQQDARGMSSYKLGSGDVISIRVFGEEDFTREKIRLNDAGTVPFPVLGEIAVLNHTLGEIERLITERLKDGYLVDPKVTVWIEVYRPFFINGMVERPGAYPYQPGLTVRRAVSIAGGFKERASLSKMFVIRDKDLSQRAAKVELSSEVGPGDTITIEESFF